jgi:hypothetical protein
MLHPLPSVGPHRGWTLKEIELRMIIFGKLKVLKKSIKTPAQK